MKYILITIFIFTTQFFSSQSPNCNSYTIVPLRIFTTIPENQCYYIKDTNNEFDDYVGLWIGTWNNKTIYITIKKTINKYDTFFKYNKDELIAKFKVVNSTGNVLFDNTTLTDENAKIKGGGFQKLYPDKYSLLYHDSDVCNTGGGIYIQFNNAAKTQIKWQFSYNTKVIYPSCQYHSTGIPEVLPKGIILTKQ